MQTIRASFFAAIAAVFAAAGPAQIVFTDVTAAAGIAAVHGGELFGIGQAWGDVDGDGCLDLYVTDQTGPNSLWLSDCAGGFALAPWNAQVAFADRVSLGALFLDFDNDGDQDLFVACHGADVLLRNDGAAGMTQVTATSGIEGPDADQSSAAAAADFDGDGDLDLFVVNYQRPDRLYRNDGGSFTDLSHLLAPTVTRPGFAAAWLDYDDDGDSDLFVVNDRLFGDWLFRNDGPGCDGWCFTDVSDASGAARPVYGMSVAVGDYDGDLDLDLYITSIGEMILLRNQLAQGSPTFVEVGVAAGVTLPTAGWGTAFEDLDLDGALDLYLCTMFPEPEVTNRVYRNLGDGSFADVSAGSGASDPGHSLGLAIADYDADGDGDLLVGNWRSGYRLYRNDSPRAASGLSVRVRGGGWINRDGIGTKLVLVMNDGRRHLRFIAGDGALGSGHELAARFGVDPGAAQRLEVRWPDGSQQTVDGPLAARLELAFPGIFRDGFDAGDAGAWSLGPP